MALTIVQFMSDSNPAESKRVYEMDEDLMEVGDLVMRDGIAYQVFMTAPVDGNHYVYCL